jgi:hypothetical protein
MGPHLDAHLSEATLDANTSDAGQADPSEIDHSSLESIDFETVAEDPITATSRPERCDGRRRTVVAA